MGWILFNIITFFRYIVQLILQVNLGFDVIRVKEDRPDKAQTSYWSSFFLVINTFILTFFIPLFLLIFFDSSYSGYRSYQFTLTQEYEYTIATIDYRENDKCNPSSPGYSYSADFIFSVRPLKDSIHFETGFSKVDIDTVFDPENSWVSHERNPMEGEIFIQEKRENGCSGKMSGFEDNKYLKNGDQVPILFDPTYPIYFIPVSGHIHNFKLHLAHFKYFWWAFIIFVLVKAFDVFDKLICNYRSKQKYFNLFSKKEILVWVIWLGGFGLWYYYETETHKNSLQELEEIKSIIRKRDIAYKKQASLWASYQKQN